jgi:hypothetical protein
MPIFFTLYSFDNSSNILKSGLAPLQNETQNNSTIINIMLYFKNSSGFEKIHTVIDIQLPSLLVIAVTISGKRRMGEQLVNNVA